MLSGDQTGFDLTKRATFGLFTPVTIRFSDTDALGHVNNVATAAYVEAARALAQHALQQPAPTTSAEARLAWAFRKVVLRQPSSAEASVLASSLKKMRSMYAADASAAAALLKVGESPRDESLDAVDHAALTAVCLMILNLDEALTKQ